MQMLPVAGLTVTVGDPFTTTVIFDVPDPLHASVIVQMKL